jgi:hypothetical protein
VAALVIDLLTGKYFFHIPDPQYTFDTIIQNLDGSHAPPTEEIGSPSKKILAALQVETSLVFTWDRLRTGICSRSE